MIGYLMPNSDYTYIYIYNLWAHFVDNIFKRAWAYFLHTVKWFQLFIKKKKSKVGDLSRGRPEGSLFDSYYTEA